MKALYRNGPTLSVALFLAMTAGRAGAQCTGEQYVHGDPALNDFGGFAVAMDTNCILMGAEGKNTPAGVDAGEVYAYGPIGASWGQFAHMTASDGAANDYFGCSIGMGGNAGWAVIGAAGKNSETGQAYIFKYNTATTQWDEKYKLAPAWMTSNDNFGLSVAMNKAGDLAVVGAPYHQVTDAHGTTPGAGVACVFVRNAAGVWSLQTNLYENSGIYRFDNDFYGTSVATDGAVVAAGAPNGNDNLISDTGYVDVWRRNAANVWARDTVLRAFDEGQGDQFGASVSMSGNWLAVGAPYAHINGINGVGAVYLFRYVNGGWVNDGKIFAADWQANGHFGGKVSLSGDHVVVGATGNDAAYVFRRSPNGWVQDERVKNPGNVGDGFASSVATEGTQFAVGAWGYDTPNFQQAGCVYRYTFPTATSDTCAGAFTVGQGQYHGCTTHCTVDGASTCGTGSPVGPDVWYRFVASATGSMSIDTQGSTLDTILSVHSTCPGTVANAIVCNDDFAAPQRWSKVTFNVAAGQVYMIRIAGYANAVGQYTLNIGGVSGCYANCDASTASPALNVNDFTCFLNKYAANDMYANCDASTVAPVLNVNDFTCFLNRYAQGCP